MMMMMICRTTHTHTLSLSLKMVRGTCHTHTGQWRRASDQEGILSCFLLILRHPYTCRYFTLGRINISIYILVWFVFANVPVVGGWLRTTTTFGWSESLCWDGGTPGFDDTPRAQISVPYTAPTPGDPSDPRKKNNNPTSSCGHQHTRGINKNRRESGVGLVASLHSNLWHSKGKIGIFYSRVIYIYLYI